MALEERLGVIDQSMMDPEVYSDAQRCRELSEEREAIMAELSQVEQEWGRRADG